MKKIKKKKKTSKNMTSTAGENALRIKKKPASLGLNSLGNLVTTVLRLSNL